MTIDSHQFLCVLKTEMLFFSARVDLVEWLISVGLAWGYPDLFASVSPSLPLLSSHILLRGSLACFVTITKPRNLSSLTLVTYSF